MIKTLSSNNPQAPHNLTKFSYKDRLFKTDDIVEQMVFHFQFDGDIILKDSDEAHDQEEYLDNKKRNNQALLDKINVAIKEEFGKDPCKYCQYAQIFVFQNLRPYFEINLNLQWRVMIKPKRNP